MVKEYIFQPSLGLLTGHMVEAGLILPIIRMLITQIIPENVNPPFGC